MKLAIKGHKTRGREVIQLLEMLGGKNHYYYDGTFKELIYTIGSMSELDVFNINSPSVDDGYIVFTLKEFLEKFPYKIGDKVKAWVSNDNDISCGTYQIEPIVSMQWDETYDEVSYKIKGYDKKFYKERLQPYKEENYCQVIGNDTSSNGVNTSASSIIEETMEEGDKAMAPTLVGEDYSMKRFGYKIPQGYEFDCIQNNEIIIKPIKPQYPKDFDECCEVLSLGEDGRLYTKGYKASFIQDFQQLYICRDAYWKIAGDEMGLDKPWEPDFGNDLLKYYISFYNNKIDKGVISYSNKILAFPTEEMRDAFFENFKDLIEECKELL